MDSEAKKIVGVITPHERLYKIWLKENSLKGERYVWVCRIHNLKGVKFDAIEYGIDWEDIASHVIDSAKRRLI